MEHAVLCVQMLARTIRWHHSTLPLCQWTRLVAQLLEVFTSGAHTNGCQSPAPSSAARQLLHTAAMLSAEVHADAKPASG